MTVHSRREIDVKSWRIVSKSISQLLSNYIGETVTIFTKSGGQSGAGFTGVILSVNDCL